MFAMYMCRVFCVALKDCDAKIIVRVQVFKKTNKPIGEFKILAIAKPQMYDEVGCKIKS